MDADLSQHISPTGRLETPEFAPNWERLTATTGHLESTKTPKNDVFLCFFKKKTEKLHFFKITVVANPVVLVFKTRNCCPPPLNDSLGKR